MNTREAYETAQKLVGCPVELYEMLDAREKRAAVQERLIRDYSSPLVSFTLNIPGPVKVLPLVPEAFFDGISAIESSLEAAGLPLLHLELLLQKTGLEAFFSIEGKSETIKAAMAPLEEESRLGRLFDIDVIRTDKSKVSREELGFSPRKCLLCGQPAHVCSRSRTHSVLELTKEISRILEHAYRSPASDAGNENS